MKETVSGPPEKRRASLDMRHELGQILTLLRQNEAVGQIFPFALLKDQTLPFAPIIAGSN